jgi:hypothetical protein
VRRASSAAGGGSWWLPRLKCVGVVRLHPVYHGGFKLQVISSRRLHAVERFGSSSPAAFSD